MNRIEPGTPVVAAPWYSDDFKIHRWSHRESTGLGVTLCGVRQEDRGNGWVLLELSRRPDHYERCLECEAVP